MTDKPEDKIIQLMRDSTTARLSDPPEHKIKVNGSANIVAGRDIHLAAAPRQGGHAGADREKAMSEQSKDDPKARTLKWRVETLEIACDQLRRALARSIDLSMSVAQLATVKDQRSADLIFRDMKQAIAEIRAMAPTDRPLAKFDDGED